MTGENQINQNMFVSQRSAQETREQMNQTLRKLMLAPVSIAS